MANASPPTRRRRTPTELPAVLLPGTVLRPPQAAAYIGRPESSLAKDRLYGRGVPFVRLSPRSIGYRVEDLDRFVASRIRKSTSEVEAA